MKKKLIPGSGLYAVIDREVCANRPPAEIAKDCVSAGVKIIQLRDKTEDVGSFYNDALLIRRITKKKALFIINDRADIAKLVGADGLHIGQADLPLSAARALLGPHKILGLSCHSLKEALSAQREGVDYISIGPIFKTPTKAQYRPVGLRLLGESRRRVKIPIVAIGGINKNNIEHVRKVNINMIAVVRAICKARNIKKAVALLSPINHRP